LSRELYLGIVIDRAAAKPVLMVSSEGGVEIEKVAAETPELIFKEHFDPAGGTSGLSESASSASGWLSAALLLATRQPS
jgi:succinyl-CoA synthetase beta subunit